MGYYFSAGVFFLEKLQISQFRFLCMTFLSMVGICQTWHQRGYHGSYLSSYLRFSKCQVTAFVHNLCYKKSQPSQITFSKTTRPTLGSFVYFWKVLSKVVSECKPLYLSLQVKMNICGEQFEAGPCSSEGCAYCQWMVGAWGEWQLYKCWGTLNGAPDGVSMRCLILFVELPLVACLQLH